MSKPSKPAYSTPIGNPVSSHIEASRPAELLASFRDFYFWASDELITLPAAGYNYGGQLGNRTVVPALIIRWHDLPLGIHEAHPTDNAL